MLYSPTYRNLEKATGRIEKLSKGLADVDHRVGGGGELEGEYKRRFQKLNEEAAKLKYELEKEQETIASAENLISKLEGEYQRWNSQVWGLFNTVITWITVCGTTLKFELEKEQETSRRPRIWSASWKGSTSAGTVRYGSTVVHWCVFLTHNQRVMGSIPIQYTSDENLIGKLEGEYQRWNSQVWEHCGALVCVLDP